MDIIMLLLAYTIFNVSYAVSFIHAISSSAAHIFPNKSTGLLLKNEFPWVSKRTQRNYK